MIQGFNRNSWATRLRWIKFPLARSDTAPAAALSDRNSAVSAKVFSSRGNASAAGKVLEERSRRCMAGDISMAETTAMAPMFRRHVERLKAMPVSARNRYVNVAACILGLALGLGIGIAVKLFGAP
jgi:hypothetical protein